MRLHERSAEQLSDLIRSVLCSLLGKERPDTEATGDLRAALRVTCEHARHDGLRAEQLVLILKAVWRDLPEGRQLPPVDADETLARVVTACIAEYYDDTPNEQQRGRVGVSSSPRRDDSELNNAEIRC